MITLEQIKEKAFSGKQISREESLFLLAVPLEELCAAADEIREKVCGNGFDLCAIVNGKSGKCGEDCKFCAQSARHHTCSEEYPLMGKDELVCAAENSAKSGVPRFSVVTSGRRLNDAEIESLCESVRAIKEKVGVSVCVSAGLLDGAAYGKLRSAGATRAHCNLETSERYFPHVCTTHTFAEKVATLNAARQAELEVCSGGIMGLGETWEDRISLAFALRELNVKSVPVNFLNPIKGTPFEKNTLLSDDEKLRVVAVYRFILPDAYVRLAGGRGLIADKGAGCFKAGANAAITGDMLTTAGISAQTDIKTLENLGFSACVFRGLAE